MTSAPSHASICPHDGPAWLFVMSTTRIPVNAWLMVADSTSSSMIPAGRIAMPLKTRQIGPCFAAEAEGLDLTKPLSPVDVKAVHAGMDEYAVLVFHGQPLT